MSGSSSHFFCKTSNLRKIYCRASLLPFPTFEFDSLTLLILKYSVGPISPHSGLQDIQRAVILAPPQDVEFAVEETHAVPEACWLRDVCHTFPLYCSNQAWPTMEPLSGPHRPAGNPLHEVIIHSVAPNQSQDLDREVLDSL